MLQARDWGCASGESACAPPLSPADLLALPPLTLTRASDDEGLLYANRNHIALNLAPPGPAWHR